MAQRNSRSNSGAIIALSALPVLFLSSCAPSAPTPTRISQLQELADAACMCDRKDAKHRGYDHKNPTPCWRELDAGLKAVDWAYMPVAADGPLSSAAICVGTKGGPNSDADDCAAQRMLWIARPLGACSKAEQEDYMTRFNECLSAQGGDEISCANNLLKGAPLTRF